MKVQEDLWRFGIILFVANLFRPLVLYVKRIQRDGNISFIFKARFYRTIVDRWTAYQLIKFVSLRNKKRYNAEIKIFRTIYTNFFLSIYHPLIVRAINLPNKLPTSYRYGLHTIRIGRAYCVNCNRYSLINVEWITSNHDCWKKIDQLLDENSISADIISANFNMISTHCSIVTITVERSL